MQEEEPEEGGSLYTSANEVSVLSALLRMCRQRLRVKLHRVFKGFPSDEHVDIHDRNVERQMRTVLHESGHILLALLAGNRTVKNICIKSPKQIEIASVLGTACATVDIVHDTPEALDALESFDVDPEENLRERAMEIVYDLAGIASEATKEWQYSKEGWNEEALFGEFNLWDDVRIPKSLLDVLLRQTHSEIKISFEAQEDHDYENLLIKKYLMRIYQLLLDFLRKHQAFLENLSDYILRNPQTRRSSLNKSIIEGLKMTNLQLTDVIVVDYERLLTDVQAELKSARVEFKVHVKG